MTRQFSLSLTLVFLYGPQIGQVTLLDRDTLLKTSMHLSIYPITRKIFAIEHHEEFRLALAFTRGRSRSFIVALLRSPTSEFRATDDSVCRDFHSRPRAPASLADHERELDARVSVLLYPRIRRKQDKLAMRRPPLRFPEDAG